MKRALPAMLTVFALAPGMALAQSDTRNAQVKRGEYLVTIGLCHDCHTPVTKGPDGPVQDMSRAL